MIYVTIEFFHKIKSAGTALIFARYAKHLPGHSVASCHRINRPLALKRTDTVRKAMIIVLSCLAKNLVRVARPIKKMNVPATTVIEEAVSLDRINALR